jgi:arylsulfatase A-like enzyme
MTRRAGALALAALAASLAAAACRRDPSAAWRGMNVVWISFDSVRADHCSFNGYARNTTPNLDKIAARGARFSRCIVQAPYTLPSYASMLTSRYVSQLAVQTQRDAKDPTKVVSQAPSPLPEDELASEALRAAGYRTGAFVQSWLSKELGFDQGWDQFRHKQESLKEKMPHVLSWLEENRNRKFFLFVYSTDTHYPFLHFHEKTNLYGTYASNFQFDLDTILGTRDGKVHPTEADIANAMAMYDEGIHWTDTDLAPLFDYLTKTGLSEKTIVVFNADHGEEFDEHGVISHGQTYYDAVVRTPLVIAAPGMRVAGTEITELVENVDVAPTLLDMVGVERPRAWIGRSLKPALSGEAPRRDAAPRRAFSEGAWTFWIGSVIEGEKKFILISPQERMLFDLKRDPAEKENLALSDRDAVRTLYHALMKHLGGPQAWIASGSGAAPSYETWMQQVMGHYGLSEESDVLKELRSLGYLR